MIYSSNELKLGLAALQQSNLDVSSNSHECYNELKFIGIINDNLIVGVVIYKLDELEFCLAALHFFSLHQIKRRREEKKELI